MHRVKRIKPDELSTALAAAVRPLDLRITLYLADLEQDALRAVPGSGAPAESPIPIDGTLAGRAFTTVSTGPAPGDGAYRIWVPMVDGSERLGVAEVVAAGRPADEAAFRDGCEMLIGLVGHLVSAKMPYGDALHRVRRSRPMTPSGELIRAVLPPQTFSHRRMVVSAVLEPCYDVGGDVFDYALDDSAAYLAVLDAMGRGLRAALTSSAVLAATRAARRSGAGLAELAGAADTAVTETFPDVRFVTGVLAELHLENGDLRYVNAGHPAPVLLRAGRAVRRLAGGRRTPLGLGLGDGTGAVGVERLQPGDRLLIYTDGVTDAVDAHGEPFGVARLVELAEHCMADRLPTPETLRRLAHTVRDHQGGVPFDDATLLLLEWSAEAAERAVP